MQPACAISGAAYHNIWAIPLGLALRSIGFQQRATDLAHFDAPLLWSQRILKFCQAASAAAARSPAQGRRAESQRLWARTAEATCNWRPWNPLARGTASRNTFHMEIKDTHLLPRQEIRMRSRTRQPSRSCSSVIKESVIKRESRTPTICSVAPTGAPRVQGFSSLSHGSTGASPVVACRVGIAPLKSQSGAPPGQARWRRHFLPCHEPRQPTRSQVNGA
jgi:hypothetical protein